MQCVMPGLPRRGVVIRDDGVSHLSPAYADAFLGLVRAGEVIDGELDRDLREQHGIGLRGFEILLHLGALAGGPDDGLGLGMLTEQAPLSQSRVSRLVAELEKSGHLERWPEPDDARGVRVRLTGPGRELLRETSAAHLESLERVLFSRLTAADVVELARITGLILGERKPRTGGARRRHAGPG